MSNTNNTTQTQTSNALQNAIMEASGKDLPPRLAPGSYVQWKSIIKRYIYTKPNNELIHYCLQNIPYMFKWIEKTILVTEGIDNDVYSTVDVCPNACEMSKAIERANQDNSLRINRGTGYENQRVVNVAGARENVGTQDAAYHKEKMLLCKQKKAEVQLNTEQVDWKDDTDDESDDQELEVHYMYMAQIQEVTPDVADNSRPIFDVKPLQKEQGDTNITIDSLDMCYNRDQDDQDDTIELAQERDLR
nr:hypothetical protein [Tanacetum cinerariifolium]